MDWLDAVDERVCAAEGFNMADRVILTLRERDRLVRIVRGVRELAEQLSQAQVVAMLRPDYAVGWNDAVAHCAAELRRLEDV